jgi:hypothetical protein
VFDDDGARAERSRSAHQARHGKSVQLDQRGGTQAKLLHRDRSFDHLEHAIGLPQPILGFELDHLVRRQDGGRDDRRDEFARSIPELAHGRTVCRYLVSSSSRADAALAMSSTVIFLFSILVLP